MAEADGGAERSAPGEGATALTLSPSGVEGLDDVLRGGLPSGALHLLQGPPGSGKTTTALQFLREGVSRGERGLYVTLSQTEAELRRIAGSFGWSLDGIEIIELSTQAEVTQVEQTIFQTADLRLDETRQTIEQAIAERGPRRIVYDSLLEVRLLTVDHPRYQRELIGLRAFLSKRGITGLLLDTTPIGEALHDTQSRGVVHGVITLDKRLPEFGRARRRIEVSKMRGVPVHDGWHDMDIREGRGVVVFPRLAPKERPARDAVQGGELIRSGRAELDDLFGGGMEPGTTTMVVGQAGTGKSTIASLYAAAALKRGESVALFLFEERVETFFRRSEGLGMDLRDQHGAGRLKLFDFNPDEISAGEFTQLVTKVGADASLRVVVIDSFTGYMSALGDERQALFDIQTLLKHLSRRGVLTFLIVAQHGLVGRNAEVRMDMSFLGDTVLLLRMHERDGRMRRDLIAVKKRHGPHGMDVRELIIAPRRVDVGERPPE